MQSTVKPWLPAVSGLCQVWFRMDWLRFRLNDVLHSMTCYVTNPPALKHFGYCLTSLSSVRYTTARYWCCCCTCSADSCQIVLLFGKIDLISYYCRLLLHVNYQTGRSKWPRWTDAVSLAIHRTDELWNGDTFSWPNRWCHGSHQVIPSIRTGRFVNVWKLMNANDGDCLVHSTWRFVHLKIETCMGVGNTFENVALLASNFYHRPE